MHARCISCHAPLGRNEVLEHFPVGRRLAFDPEKGRLWAICRTCRQWNLAPIEERWEAVEAAERLFEGAAVGASTEHVALGRVADGTELLRIGRAARPEMAAWRYGERLLGRGHRHRRALRMSLGAGMALGALPLIGTGGLYAVLAGWVGLIQLRERQPLMRSAQGDLVRRGDGDRVLLVPNTEPESWSLVIPRRRGKDLHLADEEGLVALRRLLPRANFRGGNPDQVRNATTELLRVGDPEAVIGMAARELEDPAAMDRGELPWRTRPHRIATGHPVLKLALEMAVNEETERRALEGELRLIEREWREAEELAAISDDLLFPTALRERLRRLGGRAHEEH